MRSCCATECDTSLIMGWCPKRHPPMRNGPHPRVHRRKTPAPVLEPWPQPQPLLSWVGKAKPGERMVYFSGYLANTPSAAEVAKAAMQLKDAGAVVLFQKRAGPQAFDYIAERRGGRANG